MVCAPCSVHFARPGAVMFTVIPSLCTRVHDDIIVNAVFGSAVENRRLFVLAVFEFEILS